jgi:hypothetical protein
MEVVVVEDGQLVEDGVVLKVDISDLGMMKGTKVNMERMDITMTVMGTRVVIIHTLPNEVGGEDDLDVDLVEKGEAAVVAAPLVNKPTEIYLPTATRKPVRHSLRQEEVMQTTLLTILLHWYRHLTAEAVLSMARPMVDEDASLDVVQEEEVAPFLEGPRL